MSIIIYQNNYNYINSKLYSHKINDDVHRSQPALPNRTYRTQKNCDMYSYILFPTSNNINTFSLQHVWFFITCDMYDCPHSDKWPLNYVFMRFDDLGFCVECMHYRTSMKIKYGVMLRVIYDYAFIYFSFWLFSAQIYFLQISLNFTYLYWNTCLRTKKEFC